ncbi:MAG: hypothetical protein KBA95_01880 [Acidobacteria bacterium]|nr:hypothetical protein [Acidobacteriota bacterium]
MTALSAVATAVYGSMTTDAGVGGLVALLPGGVFDHPPDAEGLQFPCAVLQGFNEKQNDTGGLQCRTVEGEIHLLSVYEGMAELYTVLDRLVARLRHEEPAIAAEWTWEAILYDGAAPADPDVLEDGRLLLTLVASFRFLVMETP